MTTYLFENTIWHEAISPSRCQHEDVFCRFDCCSPRSLVCGRCLRWLYLPYMDGRLLIFAPAVLSASSRYSVQILAGYGMMLFHVLDGTQYGRFGHFICDYWTSLASSTRTRGLRQYCNGSGIFSLHRLKSRLKYHLGRPLGQTCLCRSGQYPSIFQYTGLVYRGCRLLNRPACIVQQPLLLLYIDFS